MLPDTDLHCPRITTREGGPEFSRIVAGMWRMTEWGMSVEQRVALVEQCLEMGVTTFDHADIYGDYGVETLFGEALRLQPSLRDRIELVSKCGIKLRSQKHPQHTIQHYDTTAGHIVASAENSLRQLHTDHLDLLLIHRPDPLMDFDEVAEAFTRLQREGKVKHVGVSNFTRHQFESLNRRVPLATNQVELSPLYTAPMFDQTLDGLQDLRIAPMAWSPLAGGRLFSPDDERAGEVRAVVQEIAERMDKPFASVVFAWIMQHPSRPLPLTGSGRIAAIRDAVSATTFQLERGDWFRVLRAARGHEVA
ncbi:aldo/keto reductase [Massilia sp.]|uniref:aldo/keto reductase n=1 Tax=Massilia sp. TaxID=1882437 RepID=UPI00289C2982|nr:aldo/keto reductase [Massilia sp.]